MFSSSTKYITLDHFKSYNVDVNIKMITKELKHTFKIGVKKLQKNCANLYGSLAVVFNDCILPGTEICS